jgi:serine/threonine protein kinase
MTDGSQTHPEPAKLAAFVAGRLEESESYAVEAHLTACEACRSLLDLLPDDSLAELLRSPSALAGAHALWENCPGTGTSTSAESPPTRNGSPPAANTPSLSVAAWLPAELVGHPRYHVLELLGAGGMGSVYRAEHRLMERQVALKVIRKRLVQDDGSVKRFQREVKAAARLSHPNIVTAYDADQAGETHFLVMELVEGVSLARLVADEGPLPVALACNYVRQVALGLQHAHERGMVHRDVKPQNLMRTKEGQVKILDFGLARFLRESAAAEPPVSDLSPFGPAQPDALTQVGAMMGTPDFMAPEQASDASTADVRADIYSLGCTLYYLLTGKAPFHDETLWHKLAAHGERTPPPLAEVRADVPRELCRVVERMMAKRGARGRGRPLASPNKDRSLQAVAPPATSRLMWHHQSRPQSGLRAGRPGRTAP